MDDAKNTHEDVRKEIRDLLKTFPWKKQAQRRPNTIQLVEAAFHRSDLYTDLGLPSTHVTRITYAPQWISVYHETPRGIQEYLCHISWHGNVFWDKHKRSLADLAKT